MISPSGGTNSIYEYFRITVPGPMILCLCPVPEQKCTMFRISRNIAQEADFGAAKESASTDGRIEQKVLFEGLGYT